MKRPGEVVVVVEVDVAPGRVVPVVEGGTTVVLDADRSDVDVDVDEVDELGDPHAAMRTPTPTTPTKQRTPLREGLGRCCTPHLRPMKVQHSENLEGTAGREPCVGDMRYWYAYPMWGMSGPVGWDTEPWMIFPTCGVRELSKNHWMPLCSWSLHRSVRNWKI
jgi:hypothetical protein